MFTALLDTSVLWPPFQRALSPDEFAWNTVALAPASARRAVREISARSGRYGPRLSEADVLQQLADRYGMHEAVELVRALG